jgi:hypothetical protein
MDDSSAQVNGRTMVCQRTTTTHTIPVAEGISLVWRYFTAAFLSLERDHTHVGDRCSQECQMTSWVELDIP